MSVPSFPAAPHRVARRYLREPVPLHFPVEASVPESRWHRLLITRLCDSLERELGDQVLLASDQFLYWDATDPKQCLAPDIAIRLGGPPLILKSWKTWEHGAPHLALEIVSDSDASEQNVKQMVDRYHRAAIAEVVRFDPAATQLEPLLRIWDLIEGDLVERDPSDPEFAHCDALNLFWCMPADPEHGPTLRLARDRAGAELLPTSREAELSERTLRLGPEGAKAAEQAVKEAARARVVELEARMARKR